MQSYRSGIILASTSFFIIAMPLPEERRSGGSWPVLIQALQNRTTLKKMAGLGDEARGLSQLSMD
jgi:hypothetical protein